MSNKSIPYSLEAEKALLGNMILYPESVQEALDAGVTSNAFYLDKHKSIFSVMSSMVDKKEKIDAISLSNRLKDYDSYDKIGGLQYLMELTESTVASVNTKEYIKIVLNKSFARQIIKAGEEIANDGYVSTSSIDDALENAKDKITQISSSYRVDAEFKTGSDIFDTAIDKIQAIQNAGTSITGVKTYYSKLDSGTAGFQKGDLILLAARPSIGKTALALNFAINAAQSAQGAVALFSLEMPCEQLAMRMLSAKSKVNSQKLRTGRVSNEEWERLKEASQELKSQKIYIDDTPGIKINEMLAKARKLKNEQGLYLIIIDYIQLIQSQGHAESRQQEVSEISRKLKAMARELDVPVIALSQLSRKIEDRTDKTPQLSDLRESGSLEQDADLVMFIHRDVDYDKDSDAPERQDVKIIIAKHRNGPVYTFDLAFEKEYSVFYNVQNDIQE